MSFRASPVSALILTASLFSTRLRQRREPSRQVPVSPTQPTVRRRRHGPVTLTTPAAVSPVNGEQLSTLRPTLTVQNTTSSQSDRHAHL